MSDMGFNDDSNEFEKESNQRLDQIQFNGQTF